MRCKNKFKGEKRIFLILFSLFFVIISVFALNLVSAECQPRWDCAWGECIENSTTKTCTDLNNCSDNPTKPSVHGEISSCTISAPKDCIDNDYDGHGKGKDCFGKDIDDNNPFVYKGKPINKKVLFFLVAAIIIVSIVLILMFKKILGTKKRFEDKTKWQEELEQAKEIVKKARKKGLKDEQIIKLFKDKRWNENDIGKIMLIFISIAIILISSYLVYATSISTQDVESGGEYGYFSSLALDSSGNAHIVHQETGSPFSMRYCNNTAESWSCQTPTAGTYYTAIALDSNNKVHISASTNWYKLKYCTNKDGNWFCDEITTNIYSAYQTAIAIDKNDKVHITYFGEPGGTPKYITNKGGSWSGFALSTNYPGQFVSSSIAIDKNNNVHISYITDKLYYCYNPTATNPNCIVIDDSTSLITRTNEHNSIAVDSNDKSHISYWDDDANKLKYATNANGNWIREEVAAEDAGSNSIAVDANKEPHISYYSVSEQVLKYCSNNNLNRNWQCEQLADARGMGRGMYNNRYTAIKKGRLADSTSFSDDVHMGWGYQSESTRIVKYTRYIDYGKDWTPPLITIVNPVSSPAYTTTSIPFEITTDEDVQSCAYKLGSDATRTAMVIDSVVGSPTKNRKATASRTLGNGNYNVQFWCRDMASPANEGTNSSSFIVSIPNNPPTQPTSVLLTPTTAYPNTQMTCTASGSTDADASDSLVYYYEFWKNGVISQIYSTTNSYNCSANNCQAGNTIKCRAKAYDTKDFSIEKESNNVTIVASDTTPPILTIVSPQPINYISWYTNFSLFADENLLWCNFTTDDWTNSYNMSISLMTANYSNRLMSLGRYTARFNCSDLNGNINNSVSVSFNISILPFSPPVCQINNQNRQAFWVENSVINNSMNSCFRSNGINGYGSPYQRCCPGSYDCNITSNMCVENFITSCRNLTQVQCSNPANLGIACLDAWALTGNPDYCRLCTTPVLGCCEYGNNTRCVWNSAISECWAAFDSTTKCNDGSSVTTGICNFTITYESNCTEGFMYRNWTTNWTGSITRPASCPVTGCNSFSCLSTSLLSFFSWWNFVSSIALLSAIYFFLRKK